MDAAGGSGSWYSRPEARRWECAALDPAASAFHAGLPGYRPTKLIELPALAEELGVSGVFVKDESTRLGLPAFKVLGASWGSRASSPGRPRPRRPAMRRGMRRPAARAPPDPPGAVPGAP